MNIEQIIQSATSIVDVRTRGEFMTGHVEGSVNIPLQEIDIHLDKLKSMNQPLVLCCASGARSGQATAFLKSMSIDCVNGGSWMEVNYHIQNKTH